MSEPDLPAAPPRALGLAICALLVVTWGLIRLVMFETVMFPLAYALPLLIVVWTRDRAALWGMAGIFLAFHTLKIFWLVPPDALPPDERWANYLATVANISVAVVAVLWILSLRDALDTRIAQITAQREELRAQADELAQQNEELAQQAEELSRQAEELASQNEELQSQAEEIGTLNEELARRESLLQGLLDVTRVSGSESGAVRQICAAAIDLLAEGRGVAVAYEQTPRGVVLRAAASPGDDDPVVPGTPPDPFVELVMRDIHTAALDDAALRPDLPLLQAGSHPPRAVLCAPLPSGGRAIGALAVYRHAPHEWTDAEFRLAEWLARQTAQVLEILRMQEALRETDRLRSEFLATLSHELRNPLAPIRYAVAMLQSPDGRHGVDPVAIIDRQLRHLVRLVDDILEATRIASNKVRLEKARVTLASVVRHAIEAVAPEIDRAAHTLTVHLPDGDVWLDADPDRLAQVIVNLLNNAARYTPRGGQIRLTAAVRDAEVCLTVRDNGIGLARGDLDRVFDMFTQVGSPDGGGLGIGLALVKRIVDLHGGRVEARSDGAGRGAEFEVSLPVAPAPAAETVPVEAAPTSGTRRRVLVVDDNVDSAEMMALLLRTQGHETRTAHDGHAALAAAREFAPEVALLDIGLPGLDGYQLARRLRGDPATRSMHLVAITGWGHADDRERARAAGFDGHLTKPASPDHVLQVVASLGGELSR